MRPRHFAASSLAAIALLCSSPASHAQPDTTHACAFPASEIRLNGEPLTYQMASHVRGARRAAMTERIYTPVKLTDGRNAVYVIDRQDCARKTDLDELP